MPLFGTLKTMPLPDLLQWLGAARRSGTLRVEKERVRKTIQLQDGEIVGCSSDDPPERLGQFLLARGRISEEQLRSALQEQERSGAFLGAVFVDTGALSEAELRSHLEAKAEETIYSLFDWVDAFFRFHEELAAEPGTFPVRLRVDDVLLRGMQRFADLQRIRQVFDDPGIVLARSSRQPPTELIANGAARTLFDAIDGERTIAEILLHVHGSEYLVTKFLYELHRNGFVEIVDRRGGMATDPVVPPEIAAHWDAPAAELAQTEEDAIADELERLVIDDPPSAAPPPVDSGASEPAPARDTDVSTACTDAPPPAVAAQGDTVEEPTVGPALATPDAVDEPSVAPLLDPELVAPLDPDPAPPLEEGDELGEILDIPEVFAESSDLEPIEDSASHRMASALERARGAMGSGRYDEALEELEGLYRKYPDDEPLRRLVAEAEAAFKDKAYRHYLPAGHVPVLRMDPSELEGQNLSPTDYFLLSRIDGCWDVKSIIQISPLREVEVLRSLTRMRERGIIELRGADPAAR